MTARSRGLSRTPALPAGITRRGERAYLMVLFVVILAFVGVASAMQVLVLTSVGTTSRAFDSYRQGATELSRLERAVTEAVLDVRQVSAAPAAPSLRSALEARLGQLGASGTVVATEVPEALPAVTAFPDLAAPPDSLTDVAQELLPFVTPELSLMTGPKVAAYPELRFSFVTRRTVGDVERSYRALVRARLFAVPLTRFPVAAYDLPAEIGATDATPGSPALTSTLPPGLVPSRDPAFLSGLQSQPGVLPYHYRRRAALAAAYQYVFSQRYIDRVAEYAGITHFHDLEAPGSTATLAGMSWPGSVAQWDLGVAGEGTFGTVTMQKDAAVVFTESGATTLRLHDSAQTLTATPLLLMLLGPSDPAVGTLDVELGSIARPMVIIGGNVRVTVTAGASLNGALILDPASSFTAQAPVALGHLSYWAGSSSVAAGAVVPAAMPASAENLAPRVVYVATTAERL